MDQFDVDSCSQKGIYTVFHETSNKSVNMKHWVEPIHLKISTCSVSTRPGGVATGCHKGTVLTLACRQ